MKFKEMLKIAEVELGAPGPADDEDLARRSTEADGEKDKEFQAMLAKARARSRGVDLEIEEQLDDEADLGFLDEGDDAIQEVRTRLNSQQFREE